MKTGKELQTAIDKMAHLTDINHHTGSLILLAELLGNDHYTKILHHIHSIHELVGHMPFGLSEYRREVYLTLHAIAKKEYSEADYNRISNAF